MSVNLLSEIASSLEQMVQGLRDRVRPKSEIVSIFHKGLEYLFPDSEISIFLLDPKSGDIDESYPKEAAWPLPPREREWLLRRTKDLLIRPNQESISTILVEDRSRFLHSDKQRLKLDIQQYDNGCADILYHVLISEDELILGIVVITSWRTGVPLNSRPDFQERLGLMKQFSSGVVAALDDMFIHQKIESLLIGKRELKLRIQKDEEDLNRRILELTVLYDTSNVLGYSLDYYQIVRLVIDSLAKVLNFDICAIFLLDFVPGGEIISRINKPLEHQFINSVQSNIISAIIPFIRRPIDPVDVKLTTELAYRPNKSRQPSPEIMKSFANVPLIFKEEVIGMLNVCSTSRNAFPRNEMTFLHTMANQLASHLGRLKIVKKLEKSKMDSVIQSMTEAILMTDESNQLEVINPAAAELFGIDPEVHISAEQLREKFEIFGVSHLFQRTLQTGKAYLNNEVSYQDRIYLVNVTPVFNVDNQRSGTVMVLRDFTEIQKNNRIKTQRLEIISQVNVIIKSITDLDNLLSVLMQFILNVVNAEMGAIQLQSGKRLQTKVHSNFPDKIQKEFRFKTGEPISEFVARNKDLCFIEDYHADLRVDPQAKILLESFIGIPILAKDELIGVVSIARKYANEHPKVSADDIRTLTTITSLSGTAIQNALLYQETLKKQRLDQELKIATEIHTKLLPTTLPALNQVEFGAKSVPARAIGGDYYDFFKLDNGHLGICIADIVGKGVPAGLFMAMLKSLLHSHFKSFDSPSAALNAVNRFLFRDPVINKFVPMFYAVLDPATLVLRYCNAGHEPALRLSGSECEILDADGFPLGGFEDSVFEEKTIQLEEHDVLTFFTDGIVDARNKKNQAFGLDALRQAIEKYRKMSAAVITEKIYGQVAGFIKNHNQQDDITLVTLKVNSTYHPVEEEQPIKVKKVTVDSAKRHIKEIRAEVGDICKEMGFSDEDVFNIKLAINEAHANVIEHAYGGREDGEILFQFFIFSDRIEFLIKDFGLGMAKTIKGEDRHLTELEGSGLGVFLIRTVMDKVRYKRAANVGTELWLTKYLKVDQKQ